MRTIISAIALLALLGQAAQAADTIPTPASQGVTVGSVGGMPQSHYIEAKPIGLLSCHLDLSTGLGECLPVDALAQPLVLPDTAAQHDAHVQDWQRRQITDRATWVATGGGSAK